MSTIAVNAITDASGGSTTSINGITPNAYNTVGKNLVINGAMQIAQRGTSETGITTNGYHTCDRWLNNINALGTWTSEQSTDAPDGFSNSLKLSCTTADASPAAADYVIVQHRIEGQMCQQLAKGTASAKSVTVSFWVKCNKTGDMQVDLFDNDNSRIIGNTVTINTADTWEKKTITFAGDTTGALDNDNNFSLMIEWWLDSGADWSSGTTPTTWQSNAIADRNAGGTLALGDSTSNYINITGVQLEVGESATEFEHRPYPLELALCQRYYQICRAYGGTRQLVGLGYGYDADDIFGLYHLTVPLRSNSPTMSYDGVCLFLASTVDTNTIVFGLNQLPSVNHTVITINVDNTGSPAIGARDCIAYGFTGSTTTNYIDVDAEL